MVSRTQKRFAFQIQFRAFPLGPASSDAAPPRSELSPPHWPAATSNGARMRDGADVRDCRFVAGGVDVRRREGAGTPKGRRRCLDVGVQGIGQHRHT